MLPNASTGSVSTAQRAVVAAAAVAVAAAQANIKKEWTRRNCLLEKEFKKLRANVHISRTKARTQSTLDYTYFGLILYQQ